jgi:hypothetical protein
MSIVVYCAIFGGYDYYLPDLNRNPDARYILFTDQDVKVDGWEVRTVPSHLGRRKTARYYKLNSCLFFPEAEYTVWHDGWLQLICNPAELIPYLGDNDIAMEKHRERNCVYQEAEEVIRVKKVLKPEYAREQVNRYHREGFPPNYGLTASYLVVRRNTPDLAVLETMWWNELDQHTMRDQLGFMPSCWRLGMRCSILPHGQGKFYKSHPHARSSY